MNLMKLKVWYFIFSLIIILPGLYYLFTFGLKLGIDFTGGALIEYKFQRKIDVNSLKENISKQGIEIGSIISSGNNSYIIRTKALAQDKINNLKNKLEKDFGNLEERREENVEPVIGKELEQKTFFALIIASIAIVIYIAFSFRKVPKPQSSFR